ncbi:MAG TPA: hypothetical protein VF157_01635, partial [Chloroflexota bacterium]
STLVITTIGTGLWRPARVVYRYAWRPWRWSGWRIKSVADRERWLGFFGPVSLLLLLVCWLLLLILGWALIYKEVLGSLHGASDWRSLAYYAGATLLTPSFGGVTHDTAPAGALTLLETVMGIGTIALLISYLPVLYGAYNRREARLLTLDDPAGGRMTPSSVIRVHSPDGDLARLYDFFAEWELWTADILESHVSYPMLVYFRSQHVGQSWITALGVVLDAATLVCAIVPGADEREPYFLHRRGRRAVNDIAARLHVQPEPKVGMSRELFGVAYESLRGQFRDLNDIDTAWQKLSTLRATYGPTLQGLFDYLAAPEGFWGHSAELD